MELLDYQNRYERARAQIEDLTENHSRSSSPSQELRDLKQKLKEEGLKYASLDKYYRIATENKERMEDECHLMRQKLEACQELERRYQETMEINADLFA